MKETKYKIVAEYDRFYLAVHEKGYKECFSKVEYKPTKNGYIVKKSENHYSGGEGLPPEKVNRSFNPSNI